MSNRDYPSELAADALMDEILTEASGPMSPTLTPFESFGSTSPADESTNGPASQPQTQAHELWEIFRRS